MKNISSLGFKTIVMSLVMSCLVACGSPPGGPPPKMTGTPKVSVVKLQPAPLTLTSVLPGRVTAVVDAQIRPQVTGIIEKKLFEEGSLVEAGQLLYKIDPVVYQAAVDSATAALARAEAALAIATLNAKRNKNLVAINAVSKQQADETNAILLQAKADVAAAKAELHTQRINLEFTNIKAPVTGRISRTSTTVGTLVTANQPTVLATIQQLDPIFVDISQPSLAVVNLKQSLGKGTVQKGANDVGIVLQNGINLSEKGTLKFSDVTVDKTTDTVTLRVKVPNKDDILMPGMYVQALLQLGVVQQAILLPQKSVMRDASGNSFVWVVNKDNVVEQRAITVARAIGNQWLLKEGLSAGERVIVKGFQKARVGAKVEIASLAMSVNPDSITQH